MRRIWQCLLIVSVLGIYTSTAAAMPKGFLAPNKGKPLSYQSGQHNIIACSGAAQTIAPIAQAAQKSTGVRWQILVAVVKVESGFGCDMGKSSAGAIGWTQFLPATWKTWGMDADGDRRADPNNAVDSIWSTARYLRANGAPKNYRHALFAYNHADWYVKRVLQTAHTFDTVSADEFTQIAEFSAEGQRLKAQITLTKKRLAASSIQEKKLLRSVRRGQHEYQSLHKRVKAAQKDFRQTKQRLNQATARYIQFSQSVVAKAAPQTGDGNLLEYAADARAQDAVLVYQSASSLLQSQADGLHHLRTMALQASQSQVKTETLLLKQQDVNRQRVDHLLQAKDQRTQRQTAIASLRRDQQLYKKTLKTWVSDYGKQLGQQNFINNPFTGDLNGLNAQAKTVMLARAELQWGVHEVPDNSNDSPDIARYRSALDDHPGPGPWCAYFVSYILGKAGYELPGGGFGAVDDMVAYAKSLHGFTTDLHQAQPGDVIFFNQHVGIVEQVSPTGDITTIEGNASNAVSRETHRQNSAVGIWRVATQKHTKKKHQ